MILQLEFSKEEMSSFLYRLGYETDTVKTWNADYDNRFSDANVAFIDVDIAFKDFYPSEDLKEMGSYTLSSKYGLEKQFVKELKFKLLNN